MLRFAKITRPNIRKLSEGKRVTEHGITFERLTNGDGRYNVSIMVDGIRIHRVIGRESDGVNRKQAEDFIEQVKTDARKGRLNLPKGRKTVLGFRKSAKTYLKKLEEEGGKDLVAKEWRLRKYITPFFKDKPLRTIYTFDIERYKKSRLGQKTPPGTINRELAVLSHLFNKALEWRWLNQKPALIRRLKEDSGRIVYLTSKQATRLLEEAKKDQNPFIYPFCVIGLETGMRKMEILSIRLKNIDLPRRVIYIPQAKAGAREQPITGRLATFLKGYMDIAKPRQEWLFPSPIFPKKFYVNIKEPFQRVVKKVGLDPKQITPHTLRHTAITHLVQAGVDLPTVKRISGHKTLLMVERYCHQNGEHIQAAMDKFEKRIRVVNK
jgi:integrase